jgi:para-nitrobenzyl esterase
MNRIVTTESGRLRGQIEQDVSVFHGIPYAAPPVGPLGWRPPARAESWSGIRDALKPGNAVLAG